MPYLFSYHVWSWRGACWKNWCISELHHHLLLLAETVSAVTEYSDRSRGGNSVQYGFAFLWCLVPFPVSASVFERSKGEKSIPWRRWRFLWRLIFASSVWKQFQIHIFNLKENITVSDSTFFARTETKHSGRKVRNLQMSKVTGDNWSRSALFFY